MKTPLERTPSGLIVDRRRFLQMGGMGMIAAVVAACAGDAATTTTAGGSATTAGTTATTVGGADTTMGSDTTMPTADEIMSNLSSIVMGDFNPNYAAQWGYMVALSLGYMAEVGIEELEQVLTDEYIAGLLGGSIDITHGDTSVFLSAADSSGEPIKMISMYRTSEWQIMGVGPGIETAEDLVGKTITGGPLDGRNTFVQKKIVRNLGLDPDVDVQFVPTDGGSDGRLQAVLAGTVDAASVFPRHRFALEEAGGGFLYEQLEAAPQEAFGAMEPWLAENRDAALAWQVAELKGRQWLFDPANKDQAYQIMIDYGYEIPPEFVELYQVELDQFSPDGGFDVEEMDVFLAELAETGDVPEGIDWQSHFDFTILWDAQDHLGIPRSPVL